LLYLSLEETAFHSKIMLASKFDNVNTLYLVFQFVKSNQYLKISMYKILEKTQ